MNRRKLDMLAVVALVVMVAAAGGALVIHETRQQAWETRIAERQTKEPELVSTDWNPEEDGLTTATPTPVPTPTPRKTPRGEGPLVHQEDSKFLGQSTKVELGDWKLTTVTQEFAFFRHNKTEREFGMRVGDSFEEIHDGVEYRISLEEIDPDDYRITIRVEDGTEVRKLKMQVFD